MSRYFCFFVLYDLYYVHSTQEVKPDPAFDDIKIRSAAFMEDIGNQTWGPGCSNYVQAMIAFVGLNMHTVAKNYDGNQQPVNTVKAPGEKPTMNVKNYFECNKATDKIECDNHKTSDGVDCEWCDHTVLPDWDEKWKSRLGRGSCHVKHLLTKNMCNTLTKTVFELMLHEVNDASAIFPWQAHCMIVEDDDYKCGATAGCFPCQVSKAYGWRWASRDVAENITICGLETLFAPNPFGANWCARLQNNPPNIRNWLEDDRSNSVSRLILTPLAMILIMSFISL